MTVAPDRLLEQWRMAVRLLGRVADHAGTSPGAVPGASSAPVAPEAQSLLLRGSFTDRSRRLRNPM
jgi:hypothetical protein